MAPIPYFWQDMWLFGKTINEIAPIILTLVPTRIGNMTVFEAMSGLRWVNDIHGIVTMQVLLEFLNLCDLIDEVPLQSGVEDKHIWCLSTSGKYSAKSAYNALFQGSTPFNAWERIWKSWAPNKCRFFLWLVAHNRCWMADRLARRNLLQSDRCPLCDQEETIHHLLATCVFARQFWANLLQRVGLPGLSPQPSKISFDDWWGRVINLAPSTIKGGLNSPFVLGAWTLWLHRNDCVFNGVSPRLSTSLAMAREEAWAWCMAGTKGLSLLTASDLVVES
jgi:hypothetical protein